MQTGFKVKKQEQKENNADGSTQMIVESKLLGQQASTSYLSWWRHQMETFSALLTICAGNSALTGRFPAQRPVTRGFDVFFDLRLNKRLSKQCWGWWFETPSRPLWRHCNVTVVIEYRCHNHFFWLCAYNFWSYAYHLIRTGHRYTACDTKCTRL